AGVQILDEVPRREAADVEQGVEPPDEAGATGEDGVGGVAREHAAAIEEWLVGAEGVAGADARLLDSLDVGNLAAGGELAERVAEKIGVADQVVGVARLHIAHAGAARQDQGEGGGEVASLGLAFVPWRVL